MKTIKSLLFLFIVLTYSTTSAQVSSLGTSYAEIVPVMGVTQVQQLSFGQFSPLANGGVVSISPEGLRTTNGSIILTENPVHQGVFSVTGTQNNKLNIILPNSPVYIYHQNGVNSMYIDNWTVEMPNGGFSESGKDFIVNIGASIHVGPIESNPIGLYIGSYPVVFFYN